MGTPGRKPPGMPGFQTMERTMGRRVPTKKLGCDQKKERKRKESDPKRKKNKKEMKFRPHYQHH